MPTISSLFVYPIKSCRGLSLTRMTFDALGPVADRRLMLVTPGGKFISLRTNPLLAQIQPRYEGRQLWVSAPGVPPLKLPSRAQAERIDVTVWSWSGSAADMGDEPAAWFRRVLGEPCRLVRTLPRHKRVMSHAHTDLDAQVGFADGYPLLITTLESLSDLNRRLASPVSMYRFRPNVVIRDCQPFEEDTWETLIGNSLTLHLVKACSRCTAITVDQHSLQRGREPLATLAGFRRNGKEVTFGQNALATGEGHLTVGEAFSVGSWRPKAPPPKHSLAVDS